MGIYHIIFTYPTFGTYVLHKLHEHKLLLLFDKRFLNVLTLLAAWICFGNEFHISFALYPKDSNPYVTVLGIGYVRHSFLVL